MHGGSLPQATNIQQPVRQSNPVSQSIQSTLENVQQYVKTDGVLPENDVLPVFITGSLAFYATAFSSQFIQHRFLKISTGTRPAVLPISVGLATVALGSWMGHLVGLGTSAAWGTVKSSWKEQRLLERVPTIGGVASRAVGEMTRPMSFMAEDATRLRRREGKEAWMHAARICVLGLLAYKTLFRSRFSALSPSSYTARGAFARVGLPASPDFQYATRPQRDALERLGRRFGCHTCGSRMLFSAPGGHVARFHGDHVPPVAVAKRLNGRWYRRKLGWKVSQKFYPQCRNCSNKQGGMIAGAMRAGKRDLRAVGGGKDSHFHGRRLRLSHLTGGVVAAASVGKSNAGDKLPEASRQKVRSLQDWTEGLAKELKERVDLVWRNN